MRALASCQCDPVRSHTWVEFVVGSSFALMDYSPGTPVSLPPEKPAFPNSFLDHSRILGSGLELACKRG